jgi:hypothetical protein
MAAEAEASIDTWIDFLEKQDYRFLFRDLRDKTTTRSKYIKQHSGCWDLQLLCMIMYHMYITKNILFLNYFYSIKKNEAENNRVLGSLITSIYKRIQKYRVRNLGNGTNYLHKYITGQQFNTNAFNFDNPFNSDIKPFNMDDLKTDNMYPMMIYSKPQGHPKYVILHYFTIIKSGQTYRILNSWGSDTICVLPSIESIDIKEFLKLSGLLSLFDTITDKERQECMELVEKYFLKNAVAMYSNRNSEKKGAHVMPKEGIELEQKTFEKIRSYHIAYMNKYNRDIHAIVSRSNNSTRKSINSTSATSASATSAKTNLSRSRSPRMNNTHRHRNRSHTRSHTRRHTRSHTRSHTRRRSLSRSPRKN